MVQLLCLSLQYLRSRTLNECHQCRPEVDGSQSVWVTSEFDFPNGSKAQTKNNGNKQISWLWSYWIENVSDKMLIIWPLLKVPFKHVWIINASHNIYIHYKFIFKPSTCFRQHYYHHKALFPAHTPSYKSVHPHLQLYTNYNSLWLKPPHYLNSQIQTRSRNRNTSGGHQNPTTTFYTFLQSW
jgi:hypothetical protein